MWSKMRCAALALVGAAATAGAQLSGSLPVRITEFHPAEGVLRPGDSAVSRLGLINRSAIARIIWIGYSVQDPDGVWFDIPAHPLSLRAGERVVQSSAWVIPVTPRPEQGTYRVIMGVWDREPGRADARRLDTADKRDAFSVYLPGALASDSSGAWRPGQHPLGRGRLRPEQAFATGEGFRLLIPSGTCDGAEVRTSQRFQFGEFSARMRVPDAEGSLSALFLYGDTRGGNDEIDIEVYNDATRRVMLSAWIDGRMTQSKTVTLPFDPRAAFHEYSISWSEQSLAFQADGTQLTHWNRDYPRRPMKVFLNAWWPSWMTCKTRALDRELSVEWIRVPAPAR